MESKIPNFSNIEDAMNYLSCLKIRNEELKQALYDTKKTEIIQDTEINEIKSEVELLKNRLAAINQIEPIKLETEDVKVLKQQIKVLDIERKEQQEENDKLNQTYADIQANLKKIPKEQNDTLDITTLNKAKEENESLKKLIESQKIKNEKQIETLEEVEGLKKNISRLREEYDQMKSLNDYENSQFESIDQVLQATRAESSKFSAEIASLKEAPINDIQRGNGLFAEVEDRSSDLVMRNKLINLKYQQLTKILKQTKMQRLNLKSTNTRLCMKVGANKTDATQECEDIGPSPDLNKKILELEELMSALDQRSNVPKLIIENDDLKWVQTILNKESSTVKSSTEKMRNISKQLYDTVVEMCKVNVEAEKLRQENMKNEVEIKELMSQFPENKENTFDNKLHENIQK